MAGLPPQLPDMEDAGAGHNNLAADEQHAHPPGQAGCSTSERQPRTFSGQPDDDVEDWLKHYQRVSRSNRWSTTKQLENVVFFLVGTASLWFDNHESALTTWDIFVDELKRCFGDSTAKVKQAEQTLSRRAQLPGETCTTYIEAVLKLCGIVSATMSDEDKVGHLLKGIAEDVYNFLITKEDLHTPSDLRKHCRAFEALKRRRILPKFGRLDNVPTIASVNLPSQDDISSIIRRVVKEELAQLQAVDTAGVCHQCAFDQRPHEPPVPRMRQSYFEPRPNYTDRFERRSERPLENQERRQAASRRFTPQPPSPGFYQPTRSTSPETTRRDTRTCYNCGLPGHIARYCYRRQQRAPRFNVYTPYVPAGESRPFQSSFQRQHAARADSPCSDRSVTPPPARQQRSPSPRRRSGTPPPLGN